MTSPSFHPLKSLDFIQGVVTTVKLYYYNYIKFLKVLTRIKEFLFRTLILYCLCSYVYNKLYFRVIFHSIGIAFLLSKE